MAKLVIRKMLPEDIHELAVLYRDYWGEDSNLEKMRQKYSELETNPDYIFLSAIDDQKLVGSIMGIVCHELYGECDPFLVMEDLIVHKSHRAKGIGTQLLQKLEKIAKEKGCCQIQFITESTRTRSISFYESLGYNPHSHVGFKKSSQPISKMKE